MKAAAARLGRAAAALVALGAAAGCSARAAVERSYGGRVIEGRYVEPEAYAAFLAGAIAEASGDVEGARAAFAEAERRDPRAAEIRIRLEALRREAVSPGPVPGTPGSAGARGVPSSAPAAGVTDAAARDRLVAITATARDRVAAWGALAAWAAAHGEPALWGEALGRLAPAAPSRRMAAAQVAADLAGIGEPGDARVVAGAAADADTSPLAADAYPLTARLAVDEAIARHDADAVRARAVRVRVGLDEAAARAVLAGDDALARALLAPLCAADPQAWGPRLVRAACDDGDALGAGWALGSARPAGRVPAAVLVAFGRALAHAAAADDARAALAAIAHEPIVSGDDRVVRPAVALAARGLIDAADLPADGAIELAALRGAAPPESAVVAADERHRYLAEALADPRSGDARARGERLAGVEGRDPIVAAAAALVRAGAGPEADRRAAAALLARDAADPLLAAVALRLARGAGDGDGETARRAGTALEIAVGPGRPRVPEVR